MSATRTGGFLLAFLSAALATSSISAEPKPSSAAETAKKICGTTWKLHRDGKFRLGIVFQPDGKVVLRGGWAKWRKNDNGTFRLIWPDSNFVDLKPDAQFDSMTGVDDRDKRPRRLDRIRNDPVALRAARTRYLGKLDKLAQRYADKGDQPSASAVQREIESLEERARPIRGIAGTSWRLHRKDQFKLIVEFQKDGKVTIRGDWAKWKLLDNGKIRVTWADSNFMDLALDQEGKVMTGKDDRDGAPRKLVRSD